MKFCYFDRVAMGIPALEDDFFVNLLIFDYLYVYINIIPRGRCPAEPPHPLGLRPIGPPHHGACDPNPCILGGCAPRTPRIMGAAPPNFCIPGGCAPGPAARADGRAGGEIVFFCFTF